MEEPKQFTDGNPGPGEEAYSETDYMPPYRSKKESFISNIFKKPKLLIAIGIVLLILLAAILLQNGGPQKESKSDVSVTQAANLMEQRVQKLEMRVFNMEKNIEQYSATGPSSDASPELEARLFKLESDINIRINEAMRQLEDIQKKLSASGSAAPVKASAPSEPAKPSETPKKRPVVSSPKPAAATIYHQVASGETLYSICRKYGMKVDAFCKLNNITPQSIIRPGQKLAVIPAGVR